MDLDQRVSNAQCFIENLVQNVWFSFLCDLNVQMTEYFLEEVGMLGVDWDKQPGLNLVDYFFQILGWTVSGGVNLMELQLEMFKPSVHHVSVDVFFAEGFAHGVYEVSA